MGEGREGKNWIEEEYIGGRLFRRLADGRIIEVNVDGTVEHEFEVGGREFDEHSASFTAMTKAVKIEEKPAPEVSAEGSKVDKPELTTQERIVEYLQKTHDAGADTRLLSLKKSYSGVFTGSVKDLIDGGPRSTLIKGTHLLGDGHGMNSGTKLTGSREDALRQKANLKPTTFRDHMQSGFESKSASEPTKGYSAHLEKTMGGRGLKRSDRLGTTASLLSSKKISRMARGR